MMSSKVVLVDDHPVINEGISKTCGERLQILQRISKLENLIEALDMQKPDVLVSEVRLKGQDALKVIEGLIEKRPELKIVIYSGWENPTYIARAASIGCHDFISKSAPVEKLFESIDTAMRGEKPPEDSLIVIAQTKMRRPRQTYDHDVPLTNREMQVLRHVSMGLSNREIGKSLGISVETVKEHVQNILRKLDVNDRTQAAVWAVKRGLA